MNSTQRQLAHQIRDTAALLIDAVAKPAEPPKSETVIAKVTRLYNADNPAKAAQGGMPLAVVNYNGKRLGVFWIGSGKDNAGPTVGLRKLVKSGRLHRGHRRFAKAYWVLISDLASHDNS